MPIFHLHTLYGHGKRMLRRGSDCKATEILLILLECSNNELLQLQGKHYTPGCVAGDDPYAISYDEITLALRKGWTRKNGAVSAIQGCADGHLCSYHVTHSWWNLGRKYRIYDQPQNPEIDMRRHLPECLRFLQAVVL